MPLCCRLTGASSHITSKRLSIRLTKSPAFCPASRAETALSGFGNGVARGGTFFQTTTTPPPHLWGPAESQVRFMIDELLTRREAPAFFAARDYRTARSIFVRGFEVRRVGFISRAGVLFLSPVARTALP